MRLSHARWLTRFAEVHGIGLDPSDLAEIKDASFRMLGLYALGKPVHLAVDCNVEIDGIPCWERTLLAAIASELRQPLDPAAREDDEDALW